MRISFTFLLIGVAFISKGEVSDVEMDLATPESQGVSSRGIQRWIEACEQASADGTLGGFHHGFVIVRHGKTIAEGTWAPQNTLENPHMLYSHSKSFTSTAIGFLIDEGRLDLDERVVSIFPEKSPVVMSENLRQMRVRDLLTMNVGASFTDAQRKSKDGDWVKAFLHNDIETPPGTRFKYDSGATHVLAAIAERKSGMKLMDYLGEKLFKPLGMKSPWSTTSPVGIACGGWGMNMTTRDLARFGLFLLQEGRWGGRQLLSREWIMLATSRHTWSGPIVVQAKVVGNGSDWVQGYGFQFWRCRHGAYRADGAGGQLTVVFPKENAVVSVSAGLGDMQKELNLIWEHLLPAFKDAPVEADETGLASLRKKCANLALPLDDRCEEPFPGFSGQIAERKADGWELEISGQKLSIGDGGWARTKWKFSDSNIEPLFELYGTHEIAACGHKDKDGSLVVVWHFLGGTRHGRYRCRIKE